MDYLDSLVRVTYIFDRVNNEIFQISLLAASKVKKAKKATLGHLDFLVKHTPCSNISTIT